LPSRSRLTSRDVESNDFEISAPLFHSLEEDLTAYLRAQRTLPRVDTCRLHRILVEEWYGHQQREYLLDYCGRYPELTGCAGSSPIRIRLVSEL